MERYLFDQNLHWQGNTFDAGIHRELLSKIKTLIEIDQIIAVSGVRRCGKSFLLEQIINYLLSEDVPPENILLVNLEFPVFSSENSNEILNQVFELYLRLKNPTGKLYVFLDEIQTVENWETWLKYNYDQRKSKIKFFITGSNSQLLSSEFASRLSGRVIEKKLYPFSLAEILDFYEVNHSNEQSIYQQKEKFLHYVDQYLDYGGMPELLAVELVETKRELLLAYFNTIIYKDIIPRFSIRGDKTIYRLAIYLLANSTSLLNVKKLSEYLKIAKREQTRLYLDYLQQAYMNFVLPKFDFSQKTQLLSQKKTYAIDTGFVNLLPLRFSMNKGKLLENAVFLELMKRYNEVFFHRENGSECDFIVYDQLGTKAVYQVCYEINEKNRGREIKGLLSGCLKIGAKSGNIITYDQNENVMENGVKIRMIPFWKWILLDKS